MKSDPGSRARGLGLALALLGPAAGAAPAPRPAPESGAAVFEALEAEMARSLARLRQDEFGPPYFLAYRLNDARHYRVDAELGAVAGDELEEYHVAYVEARYGDRAFDNTDLSYEGVNAQTPEEPAALRQTFWLLTDKAYRGAVAGWLEKKAKRAAERVAEPLDDFSPEPPQRAVEEPPPAPPDRERLRALVARLSGAFRGYPGVLESNVAFDRWWGRRLLVTSEGTRLLTPAESMPDELTVFASARADDGSLVEDSRTLPLRATDGPPPEAKLADAVTRTAEEVQALRGAPAQDAATAPAVLDPEMSGVLFHEALGHKLEGQRQREPREGQIFRDLIGKAILPAFLSVDDDPTLESFRGSPLHGSYEFDAEGSRARRVTLVDHGVLRGFLMSRWPVKGFPATNGHGRAGWRAHPTGRMANLIVRADGAVSVAELERRLRELARRAGKPYGFLLVGAIGGENPTARESAQTLEVRPRLVYRVDAQTGRRTLVRGVKLVGTPLAVLNRIVAAGDDLALANGFHCGAESGWVPVSQIAPSLLLSEVELQRLPDNRERPPILPPPLHDRP